MNLTPGAVLRFALVFLIVFGLMLWAYPHITRFYEPAVLAASNWVMEQMDPPTRIDARKAGGWRALDISRGYTRGFALWYWWQVYLHFLSLALLPALLAATPAPWWVRLRLMLISFPLLYVVHAATIIGIVRANYCFIIDPTELSCRLVLRVVNTSGQLFAVGLWGVLTWRYWIPGREDKGGGPSAVAGTA